MGSVHDSEKSKSTDDRSLSDEFAAVIVAVLLILTAWGNAIVLLVVSLVGLVAWLIVFPKDFLRKGALPVTVGAAVAAVIALAMLWLR